MIPYITTSGPSWDLEMFAKERGGYTRLPDPQGLPFSTQAGPIPDFQQKHVGPVQVEQMQGTHQSNPLILGRFIGTSAAQVNQPEHLSVNERTNNWL